MVFEGNGGSWTRGSGVGRRLGVGERRGNEVWRFVGVFALAGALAAGLTCRAACLCAGGGVPTL